MRNIDLAEPLELQKTDETCESHGSPGIRERRLTLMQLLFSLYWIMIAIVMSRYRQCLLSVGF
jgi:hypothetical protein